MRTLRCAVLLLVLAGASARADDCTFPNPVDPVPRPKAGTAWIDPVRQLVCIVNRLAQRLARTPPSEVICANVSVNAATRLAVSLTASTGLVGNESIHLYATDSASPPMLDANGVATPGGAVVTGYVFNRDPVNDRTGKLCALIVRP